MIELGFFLFFAAIAVAAALGVILQRNPIYSALSLIVVIASMAGLFLLQNATFLAVLQIVIYAGAVMALFLFVLMMVDVDAEPKTRMAARSKLVLAVLLIIVGAVLWTIGAVIPEAAPLNADFSVHSLSRSLFTGYLFPFEAIAVLIISAVIGALYVARKETA